MQNPKITVGIVLYQNVQYLKTCVKSLLAQKGVDFELIFKDNDSHKQAQKYIEQNFSDTRIKFLDGKNNFHSGGHNQIIQSARGKYYFCGSYDMDYPTDFLVKLVKLADQNPEKILAPKILRWDFANQKHTEIIDSTGIIGTFYHKFSDRGQGEKDANQYEKGRVFGASGAAFFAPTEILKKVGGFDENLHYKNDVDLAYRLNWLGFETLFVPEVVCFHDRQVSEIKTKSDFQKTSSQLGQEILIRKNFSQKYGWHFRLGTKIYMLIRRVLFPKVKLPTEIKPVEKQVLPAEMQKLFK